jgi:SSS family solute:Na+ symporter
VAHKKGYVTAADFVKGRFGNRPLALAIALTGLIATMPYIALQLVGMQVVLAGLGLNLALNVPGFGAVDAPLLIAFVILALYTYTSGLRAPAMIAVVKDILIYVTVFAAVIIVPAKLGGYGAVFSAIDPAKLLLAAPTETSWGAQAGYATLALGSALALFLYPHALTGILSASSRNAIKRNAVILPAYSFALGLIALIGFMAVAAGVQSNPAYADGFAAFKNNYAVTALFLDSFPAWFVGLAFAAVAIGALVPAAIMSIACANLFTRNIYKEFINPGCTHKQESDVAKIVSLVVKVGALFFVIELSTTYAVQLQLLGGIWIIQTLPAVLIGLYTNKMNPWALFLGWAAGISWGTWMASQLKLASSIYPLQIFGTTIPVYAALSSLLLNIAIVVLLTLMLGIKETRDETVEGDYV